MTQSNIRLEVEHHLAKAHEGALAYVACEALQIRFASHRQRAMTDRTGMATVVALVDGDSQSAADGGVSQVLALVDRVDWADAGCGRDLISLARRGWGNGPGDGGSAAVGLLVWPSLLVVTWGRPRVVLYRHGKSIVFQGSPGVEGHSCTLHPDDRVVLLAASTAAELPVGTTGRMITSLEAGTSLSRTLVQAAARTAPLDHHAVLAVHATATAPAGVSSGGAWREVADSANRGRP